MDNKGIVKQEDGAEKQQVSKLAIGSLACGILALLLIVGECSGLLHLNPEMLLLIVMMLAILGLGLGVWAFTRIPFSKNSRWKILSTVAGIAISLFALVVLYLAAFSVRDGHGYHETRVRANLRSICVAFELFANDHNDTLPVDCNWCDILMNMPYIPEKSLLQIPDVNIPKDKSSFALNKNVLGRKLSDLNPDTVILFETDPGWNQCGGPELVRISERFGGCFVLHANRDAELVKKSNISKLRWEP